MSVTTTCPHCGAETSPGAFCTQCGQALPSSGDEFADVLGGLTQEVAGSQRRLKAELQKAGRQAAGALLVVAILQVIVGVITVALLPPAVTEEQKTAIMVTVFGIAAVFFGLFVWARAQPFPAAIVGLVLFVTLHLLEAIVDPKAIYQGLLVKIIVIMILAQAIKAGVQYRRLQRERAA